MKKQFTITEKILVIMAMIALIAASVDMLNYKSWPMFLGGLAGLAIPIFIIFRILLTFLNTKNKQS